MYNKRFNSTAVTKAPLIILHECFLWLNANLLFFLAIFWNVILDYKLLCYSTTHLQIHCKCRNDLQENKCCSWTTAYLSFCQHVVVFQDSWVFQHWLSNTKKRRLKEKGIWRKNNWVNVPPTGQLADSLLIWLIHSSVIPKLQYCDYYQKEWVHLFVLFLFFYQI